MRNFLQILGLDRNKPATLPRMSTELSARIFLLMRSVDSMAEVVEKTLAQADRIAVSSAGLGLKFHQLVTSAVVGHALISLYSAGLMTASNVARTVAFVTGKLEEVRPGAAEEIRAFIDFIHRAADKDIVGETHGSVEPADIVGAWVVDRITKDQRATDEVRTLRDQPGFSRSIGTAIQMLTIRWWGTAAPSHFQG